MRRMFFMLVALLFTYAESLGLPNNWTNNSKASLALVLAGMVGSSLFLLWSLYVFIRFTLSFHRAANALRSKWDRDDRAR